MWEYKSVTAGTGDIEGFIAQLNAAGSLDWEVVSVAAVDPTIGINRLTAILKRQVDGWPAPDGDGGGWCPDPTGRHELREWVGGRWTEHVRNTVVRPGVAVKVDYPERR